MNYGLGCETLIKIKRYYCTLEQYKKIKESKDKLKFYYNGFKVIITGFVIDHCDVILISTRILNTKNSTLRYLDELISLIEGKEDE